MIHTDHLRGLPAIVRRHETELLRLIDERGCSRDEALETLKRERPALHVAFTLVHQAHRRSLAREFDSVRHFLH